MVGPEWWIHTLRAIRHLNAYVTVTTTGFNVNAVGVILLVVGICSVIIGGAIFAMSTNRHTTTRESVQRTPGGSERVVEHHNVMP
jgi:hypothetical protein